MTIPMEAGVQNEKLEWTKLWDQLGLSKGLSNEQIGLFFESLMKPVAASKLRVILGYTNATKFKNSYIVPLSVLRSFGMAKFTAAVMYVLHEAFAMPTHYYICKHSIPLP